MRFSLYLGTLPAAWRSRRRGAAGDGGAVANRKLVIAWSDSGAVSPAPPLHGTRNGPREDIHRLVWKYGCDSQARHVYAVRPEAKRTDPVALGAKKSSYLCIQRNESNSTSRIHNQSKSQIAWPANEWSRGNIISDVWLCLRTSRASLTLRYAFRSWLWGLVLRRFTKNYSGTTQCMPKYFAAERYVSVLAEGSPINYETLKRVEEVWGCITMHYIGVKGRSLVLRKANIYFSNVSIFAEIILFIQP